MQLPVFAGEIFLTRKIGWEKEARIDSSGISLTSVNKVMKMKI